MLELNEDDNKFLHAMELVSPKDLENIVHHATIITTLFIMIIFTSTHYLMITLQTPQ